MKAPGDQRVTMLHYLSAVLKANRNPNANSNLNPESILVTTSTLVLNLVVITGKEARALRLSLHSLLSPQAPTGPRSHRR